MEQSVLEAAQLMGERRSGGVDWTEQATTAAPTVIFGLYWDTQDVALRMLNAPHIASTLD
jgi:hypothetical protein